MMKRMPLFVQRLLSRPRRSLDARRADAARLRFWADVQAGRQEAEAASLPRPPAAPAVS
jgi:hypothetical protein